MRKIIFIFLLSIFLSFQVQADSIVGKKILCASFLSAEDDDFKINVMKLPLDGYHFITKKRVIVYQMSYPDKNDGFYTNTRKYNLYKNDIEIKYTRDFIFNINRTTGIRRANNLSGTDVRCKSVNIENMKKKFKQLSDYRYNSFSKNKKF